MGESFQFFISRGFHIMVVSTFSATHLAVMVDVRGPMVSVALWTYVCSPVLKRMVNAFRGHDLYTKLVSIFIVDMGRWT
jgi:hypothetical protein